MVKMTICGHDIEHLAVSLQPYYMPRDFSHAIAVCVYIPPQADADVVCDVIHTTVTRLQMQHPDAIKLISGGFNSVTMVSALSFIQYVDCPTRQNRSINLCMQTLLPPLSDHNLILHQPHYRPLVARQPTTKCSFRKWSPEVEEALKNSFQSMDWEVLQEAIGSLDVAHVSLCCSRQNRIPQ